MLNRKRVVLDSKFEIEGKTVIKVELREYKLNAVNQNNIFSLMIYVKTDVDEIELDYLGKTTNDKDKFEESFNFLCNYNGLSSTLNRIFIDLDGRIR